MGATNPKRMSAAFFLLLATCMVMPERVGTDPVLITGAKVLAVDKPPVASGIVHSWAIVMVSTPRHAILEVHITYFGETQEFPDIGALCDMTVQHAEIDGVAPRKAMGPATQVVASSLSCNGKSYRL